MLDYTAIDRRFQGLAAARVNFESTWQQIADHIKGQRDFTTQRTPGQIRTRLVYDSTGMFSWSILASALQNFLINPETEWFDLVTEDPRLMERDDVALWVFDAVRILRALIERPEAGLVGQSQEFISDLVGFNTAALFVEDVPGLPIRFSHRPLGEMFLAENEAGAIDTVVRKFELTHRVAVLQFGREKLPQVAGKLAQASEEKSTYLHLVHPTSDPLCEGKRTVNRPWRSVFTSQHERAIVAERGLDENPWMIARWSTEAGETYGRNGPGWIALPEVRMLNVMTQTLLEGAQLAIRPPIAVSDDDVINPMNLNPGGKNVIRTGAFSTDPVRLLETTGDHRLAVEMFDRRRSAVRSAFMHDLLEILQQPTLTATQVIEMVSRARNLFAPTIGRLQTDALEPMLNRSFKIAFRANAFPPPPPVLAGANLRVVYRNPVSRSQKASDAQSLQQWVAFVANLGQVDPGILDNVNFDEVARLGHQNEGVPPIVLRSRKEVEVRREMQAQMAERQQQQAELAQAAESAGKAAPALKLLQGGAA